MFNTMDIILKNLNPDFEKEFNNYLIKEFWSIDELSALSYRMLPHRYKEIVNNKFYDKHLSKNDRNKIAAAKRLKTRLLYDINSNNSKYVYLGKEEEENITSWKCIKWLAENQIPIDNLFFKALSFTLMELYFEFQPMNTALRNKRKDSRGYHEALYLKHAEELMKKENRQMSPTELYKHPHMKNVQRSIRDLKGYYKESTILKSWLPKLFPKRQKGRPKSPK